MKLNRSLSWLAAAIAGMLMPLAVVHAQTPTTTTLATGSITCKMLSGDPNSSTGQVTTVTSTFDPVALQKHVSVTPTGAVVVSHGVLSRWGTSAEVMYDLFLPDPIPVGTTIAPLSGSFIERDDLDYYIGYDELGQLTFKLDGRGKLTVTGTSFAVPVSRFLKTLPPDDVLVPIFGSCTWNLKGTVLP